MKLTQARNVWRPYRDIFGIWAGILVLRRNISRPNGGINPDARSPNTSPEAAFGRVSLALPENLRPALPGLGWGFVQAQEFAVAAVVEGQLLRVDLLIQRRRLRAL